MIYLIAPYRNRPSHLTNFIKHYSEILDLTKVKIIIFEQANNKPFNKGLLHNCGLKVANEKFHFSNEDIIILNDIDCLILPHKIEYLIKEPNDNIRHIYGFLKIYFKQFDCLGGIISFKYETFLRINGFPNNFWGWGAEDLALGWRAKVAGVSIDKEDLIQVGNKIDINRLENPSSNEKAKKVSTNLVNIRKLNVETVHRRLIIDNGYKNCCYMLKNFIENENYIHIFLDF